MAIVILSPAQAQARINRLAYQIYEANYNERAVCFVGIFERGFLLSRILAEKVGTSSPLETTCVSMLKPGERPDDYALIPPRDFSGAFIVVDDVLFTGRTLFDAVAECRAFNPARVQVAVMVDRGHRQWPVAADFVGVELGTTLQEYVRVGVDAETGRIEAWLN